jgi:hypothetical protein
MCHDVLLAIYLRACPRAAAPRYLGVITVYGILLLLELDVDPRDFFVGLNGERWWDDR